MRIWAELDLEVPRDRADALGAILVELGATGVEEDYRPGEAPPLRQPWDRDERAPDPPIVRLKTWWDPADRARVERAVAEQLTPWLAPGSTARWQDVDEASWSGWQKRFQRLVITPTFAVAPPWEAQPGDLVIEPGLAFGTGEHPTTRLCLEAILAAPRRVPRPRCLDVGTGSGVLALCAARSGYEALGIDIDPEAVSTATDNAARNDVVARFQLGTLETVRGKYELVVANLYAELLVANRDALVAHASGRIILSGIMAERAPLVRDAFLELALVDDRIVDDWALLVYDVT